MVFRTALHFHGRHIHSVDLPNIANVRQQLGAVKNVAHIIFGAYIVAEKSTVNVAILRNLLDVVEETSPRSSMSRFVKRIEGLRRHGIVAHL
jgi:hypothetical protein